MLDAKPAHAQTTFTVSNTNDSGADTIKFNIPVQAVHTISPLSELPAITDQVVIDGYSQPEASPNSRAGGAIDAVILVELNGFNSDSRRGLDIDASNVVVRGLAINRFPADGVGISEREGVRIEGNFIGTDPSGAFDRGNDGGVVIDGNGKKAVVGAPRPTSATSSPAPTSVRPLISTAPGTTRCRATS